MSLLINLRHLEEHPVHLHGEVPVEDLDIETKDEAIELKEPLEYDLEVEQLDDGLLVQGSVALVLQCKCVRCLKGFRHELELDSWTAHVPLKGEEAAPIINDCVDLTPYIREDILLEFPQHPLCQSDCSGLRSSSAGKSKTVNGLGTPEKGSPAWEQLNKLKF